MPPPPSTNPTDPIEAAYHPSMAARRASRPTGARPEPDSLRPSPSPSPPPHPKAPAAIYRPSKDKDVETPGPSIPPSRADSYVDLELSVLGQTPGGSTDEVNLEREVAALPPVDGGRDAWLFLLSATLVETTVWGLPYTVGVLHAFWSTKMFPHDEATLTLAATLQTGLMYMSAAFLGPLFTAFPQHEKTLQFVGLFVAGAALIGSAFVTKASHLVFTFGILYPFAGATYLPCATLIYEWFQARRGMATGIMFAGTGAGGTVFPFIVQALLARFGYKATMVAIGLGFLLINSVALAFVRRRVPVGRGAGSARRVRPMSAIDWSFLKKGGMWAGTLVILFTAMGNFIPSLWIPTFADAIGATRPNGTALVAIMNAASVPGNTLTGYISDRVPPRLAIFGSCALAATATLVLWGLGTTDSLLVGFSIIWGFTALSFVGQWSRMITVISKGDPTLPGLLFSFFTMLKGVGNLTSGPLSSVLLNSGEHFRGSIAKGAAGAYGNTNYGILLIYTAACTMAAAVAGTFFPTK
ncbi:hypothetical protein Q8F55_003631 [Vanrija albida]|uniref:Major facilitator superfamily (MFS) profile domain-containing protein n=1 Tax=Vanrija albida TaxID=181172 RepID=A0ABR3Q4G2_9TREE